MLPQVGTCTRMYGCSASSMDANTYLLRHFVFIHGYEYGNLYAKADAIISGN